MAINRWSDEPLGILTHDSVDYLYQAQLWPRRPCYHIRSALDARLVPGLIDVVVMRDYEGVWKTFPEHFRKVQPRIGP